MKLARFDGGRIGIVIEDRIHDVTQPSGIDPAEWPPVGMLRLIKDFARLRPALVAATKGAGRALASVRLEAPVPWPHKLLAYPVNYHDHGAEMKTRERANVQGFFMKASSSVSGPMDAIVLPDLPAREIHHECELAVIVGRTARHVPAERALDVVFGYACLLDITVRGGEERVMRKSYDTFCPLGPWIATADEVGDPSAIDLKLWVGDELRQSANTRDMIVDVRQQIAIASSVLTLQPGDVIASGTPAGVGPIRAGDTVSIAIERVGRMSVPVVQGAGGDNVALPKAPKPAA